MVLSSWQCYCENSRDSSE